MKTEVYSWRVSTELKTGLVREALRRKISLSAVVDVAARDFLIKGKTEPDSSEKQLRLHKEASSCFGILASGDAHRSENVHKDLRQRLRKR